MMNLGTHILVLHVVLTLEAPNWGGNFHLIVVSNGMEWNLCNRGLLEASRGQIPLGPSLQDWALVNMAEMA